MPATKTLNEVIELQSQSERVLAKAELLSTLITEFSAMKLDIRSTRLITEMFVRQYAVIFADNAVVGIKLQETNGVES